MAQKATPVEKPAQTEDNQLELIRNPREAAFADSTKVLAANAVKIWDMIQLVRGPRPAEGTSQRKLYDDLVNQHGGPGKDSVVAAEKLDSILVRMIENLDSAVKTKADVGESGKRLVSMLGTIQDGVGDAEQRGAYRAYLDAGESISSLWINARATTPIKDEEEESKEMVVKAGMSQVLSTMPPSAFTIRSLQYLQKSGGVKTYSAGGTLDSDQIGAFKDENSARNFLGQVGNAISARNDGRSIDCGALLAAAGAITQPQILADKNFTDAINFLKAGNGAEALKSLSAVGLLSGVFSAAQNVTTVKMDSRAVSVFTVEGTVVLDIFGDRTEYERYLAKPGNDPFGRAFVELSIKTAFDILRASGKLSHGNVDLSDPSHPKYTEASAERIDFKGVSGSVTPELALDTSIGTRPVRIIAHATFGYRQFEAEKPVSVMAQDGNIIQKKLSSGEAYMGLWGFEMQFPSRGGGYNTFAVERAGVGSVGTEMRNALAYVTFSLNPKSKSDLVKHQFLFTPMFAGFMTSGTEFSSAAYEGRPGLELAYNYMRLTTKGLFRLTPSARTEVNVNTKVWTTDAGIELSYSYDPRFEVYGRASYLVETGGKNYDQLPTNIGPGTANFGVGFRWTPGATIPSRRETAETRGEVKIARVRDTAMERRLLEAGNLLESGSEAEISGQKGKSLATTLADNIEGQMRMAGKYDELSKNPDFALAMSRLQSGNLRSGLESLAKVPEFKR
jgi:hypothetical protein